MHVSIQILFSLKITFLKVLMLIAEVTVLGIVIGFATQVIYYFYFKVSFYMYMYILKHSKWIHLRHEFFFYFNTFCSLYFIYVDKSLLCFYCMYIRHTFTNEVFTYYKSNDICKSQNIQVNGV